MLCSTYNSFLILYSPFVQLFSLLISYTYTWPTYVSLNPLFTPMFCLRFTLNLYLLFFISSYLLLSLYFLFYHYSSTLSLSTYFSLNSVFTPMFYLCFTLNLCRLSSYLAIYYSLFIFSFYHYSSTLSLSAYVSLKLVFTPIIYLRLLTSVLFSPYLAIYCSLSIFSLSLVFFHSFLISYF